jgi:hypothetical protein
VIKILYFDKSGFALWQRDWSSKSSPGPRPRHTRNRF